MAQINLLPEELRPQPLLSNRKLIAWLAAGITLFLLITGGTWWFWHINSLEDRLIELQNQRQSLKNTLTRVVTLEKDLARRREELKQLQGIANHRLRWARLLTDIGENFPRKVWLESLAATGNNTVIIRGKGASLADVGVLVHQLEVLPYFDTVVLNSVRQPDGEPDRVSFQITARLVRGSE